MLVLKFGNKMDVSIIKKKLLTIGLDAKSIKFFNAGTSKNNYLVFTDNGKYVLKLFRKDQAKIIQRNMDLMRKINKIEKLTISPIHSKVLVSETWTGYVYKFIEGKHYRELKIRDKLYNFGKIVGRFNRLTKNVLPNKKDRCYIIKINKQAKETLRYLEGKEGSLHKKAKKLIELGVGIIDKEYVGHKFRTQLIHGDLHYDNVFCEDGKYVILDVDGLKNSVLAREVSTLASYMVQRSMSKYRKELIEFFSGYESEYKLTKMEKEMMPIFMIIRKFGEVMYLLSQEHRKTLSRLEIKHYLGHTTRKLGLIVQNYSQIKKIFMKI